MSRSAPRILDYTHRTDRWTRRPGLEPGPERAPSVEPEALAIATRNHPAVEDLMKLFSPLSFVLIALLSTTAAANPAAGSWQDTGSTPRAKASTPRPPEPARLRRRPSRAIRLDLAPGDTRRLQREEALAGLMRMFLVVESHQAEDPDTGEAIRHLDDVGVFDRVIQKLAEKLDEIP
jgi:hypothetical protein